MRLRFFVITVLISLVTSAAFGEPLYNRDNPAPFHIGIITGTVSQSEDELRGAEMLMKIYGESSQGGMITHVTYPDNFPSEQETTIGHIIGLADDPLMKAIVFTQAILGVTEGFRRVKEKRSDILLLAGEPQEDLIMISEVADICVHTDYITRGYTIPLGAKKIGADTLVHVSFPRHMSVEPMSVMRSIMEKSCKDIGLKFVIETTPDPTGDVGMAGAQQYVLENVPVWLDKYGKNAAFFCTSDGEIEPLIKRITELGGYFIESDVPSPLMGYPGALGIDLKNQKGDWQAILKKIEASVINAGGKNRLGTWAFSFGYTTVAALAEYAKNYIEGKFNYAPGSEQLLNNIVEMYNKFCPGSKWRAGYLIDSMTGEKNPKYILLLQDTYIFGRGYLGLTDIKFPEKYLLQR